MASEEMNQPSRSDGCFDTDLYCPVVLASQLRQALLENEDERSEAAPESCRIATPINRVNVVGRLNLRHCTVQRPVEITHCAFRGAVDLCYAEFLQTVDFSHSTFHGTLNSGDKRQSRSIYRKDLLCQDAVFLGAVSFNGAVIDGSASFQNSQFPDIEPLPRFVDDPADFTGVRCGRDFTCTGAVFGGGVSFHRIHCESGFFKRARFEHRKKLIDFGGITCDRYLECSDTVFYGPVILRRATCTYTANFRRAHFYNELGSTKDAVYLDYASVGSLNFNEAFVCGKLNLEHIQIEAELILSQARFYDEVRISGAKIGTITLLNDTHEFKELNDGSALDRKPGSAPVDEAATTLPRMSETLQPECNQGDATQRAILENLRTTFGTQIKGGKREPPINVQLQTLLQETPTKKLLGEMAEYYLPFKKQVPQVPVRRFHKGGGPKPHGLRLDGCSFDHISGGPVPTLADELVRHFVRSQGPQQFSRDPYLQLERFYERIGNEALARDFHLQGRRTLRENARDRNGVVKWSRWQKLRDNILWTTGWGLQTWKLALACFGIVVLSGVFFALPGKLSAERTAAATAGTVVIAETSALTLNQQATTSPDLEKGCDWSWSARGCWTRRIAYSLDTFLPAVDLGLDNRWQPSEGYPEIVESGLILFGWFLIPLLVASATGFIKGD